MWFFEWTLTCITIIQVSKIEKFHLKMPHFNKQCHYIFIACKANIKENYMKGISIWPVTDLLGEGILDLAALSGLGMDRLIGCGRPVLCGDRPLCMGLLGCLSPDTLGDVGLTGGWRRENCLCWAGVGLTS